MRFAIVALLALALVFWFWLRRATDLFVLRIQPGKVRFVRGRMPPSLLRDLVDVLESSGCRGTVRAVVDRGSARVVAQGGFDDGTLQQVRNVVGRYPLPRIRAGSRP